MSGEEVGRPLDRVDGVLKVTGRASYAPETPVANAARALIVTSAVSAGRLADIDTRDAERAPGVLAVLTHKNAPKLKGADSHSQGDRVLQVLQDDTIAYNDQPIAVVVADTLEHAQHALELVRPRYEPRAVNVVMEQEKSPPVKPDKTARGPTDTDHGDFDGAWASAAVRVDATYTTPTENHNPMEPHGRSRRRTASGSGWPTARRTDRTARSLTPRRGAPPPACRGGRRPASAAAG